MKENKIELLAPAGSIDSFRAAINAGADAIYMGIDRFNARQMAKNFDIDSYKECIRYAHILNVKVYLTLNTLLYENEIKEALELVVNLYSVGLDAVIVQDIGLASLIHKIIPKLPLHASTQMSVYNLEQVKFLEKLGFKRVVLARELSLKEIEYICKNTSLEIEVFTHGALCVSYSGQCLLSEVIGGRSANRGACAQPCRMKYTLSDNSKNVIKNKYLLSKKDIFGLPYIYKLYSIGVKSLKIEGRNKTPEYVAGVTKTYRKYLNKVLEENKSIDVDNKDTNYLLQIFNRDGKSEGYFEGVRYKETITENLPKNTGIYLGEVILQKKEFIKIRLETDVDLHDGIEMLKDNDVIFSNIITCIKDENKEVINKKVKKGTVAWLGDIKAKIPIGTKVYKTSDNGINNELRKYYDGTYKKRRTIDISIKIKNGEKLLVSTEGLDKNVFTTIDYIPEIAEKNPITYENVKDAFSKTLDTIFEFNIVNAKIDKDLFVSKSKLNELRRTLVLELVQTYNKTVEIKENLKLLDSFFNKNTCQISKYSNINKNVLHIYNFKDGFDYIDYYKQKYNNDLDIVYIDIHDMYVNKNKILQSFKNVDIYIVLPNVGGKKTDEYIFKNLESFLQDGIKGVVVGNTGYIEKVIELKKKYDFCLIADYYLNIINKFSADFYYNLGFDIISPSLELTEEEINNLNEYNVEVVTDYQTAMTSRYCILGSYIADRKTNSQCTMPCVKNNYYLIDSYNKKYSIVCNNIDCIMRIVAKRNRFKNSTLRTRRVII